MGISDTAKDDLVDHFEAGDISTIVDHFLPSVSDTKPVPNVLVDRHANACFRAAIQAESFIAQVTDYAVLTSILKSAESLLQDAARHAPEWADATEAIARNLWFQGRHNDALEMFGRAAKQRQDMARLAGWDPEAMVFLPRNCAHVIGLMGHIDAFVKYKMLTGDPRPYYLIAAKHEVVNDVFLDYWRNHVSVLSTPEEISRVAAREPAYIANWNWALPDLQRDRHVHVHTGIAGVQREWQRQRRKPLLALRPDHEAMLEKQKQAWGMKPGDWHVCLHVRSAGFYKEKPGTAQEFRNTPIEDYYPLMRSISEMGGWIIRMGDDSVPPIDLSAFAPGARVIDYAHRIERSHTLDVALSATCRLFVSAPSGLHTVAHAFGRPCCMVNYPIYAGFPWHPDDILLPQRYFLTTENRALSINEILSSDLVHADHHFLLEKAGVHLVRNEPEEIVETVREALTPGDYQAPNSESAKRAVSEFDRLNNKYGTAISGRLGSFYASKYADELSGQAGPIASATGGEAAGEPASRRKLDILIPSFNRPAKLHHCLTTGLALGIPEASFVVIDDGSDAREEVAGNGAISIGEVCASFGDERVIYIRNECNMGLAASLERYCRDFSESSYTMLVNDKDEFIDAAPILSALAKLDADPALSMVMIPLRQVDRVENDRPLLFNYSRMSGREFVSHYVKDTMLQHAGMYGIARTARIRGAGLPRPLNLRAYGLEDAFGIDIDMLFGIATTGDFEFETDPHVRRSVVAGLTERYPLTFAYSYYQYAKRAMRELSARNFISDEGMRHYIGWWLLLIVRGLNVAYNPVHGSEEEKGASRIKRHLPMPILLYLPYQCVRFRIWPSREMIRLYGTAIRLMVRSMFLQMLRPLKKRQIGPDLLP